MKAINLSAKMQEWSSQHENTAMSDEFIKQIVDEFVTALLDEKGKSKLEDLQALPLRERCEVNLRFTDLYNQLNALITKQTFAGMEVKAASASAANRYINGKITLACHSPMSAYGIKTFQFIKQLPASVLDGLLLNVENLFNKVMHKEANIKADMPFDELVRLNNRIYREVFDKGVKSLGDQYKKQKANFGNTEISIVSDLCNVLAAQRNIKFLNRKIIEAYNKSPAEVEKLYQINPNNLEIITGEVLGEIYRKRDVAKSNKNIDFMGTLQFMGQMKNEADKVIPESIKSGKFQFTEVENAAYESLIANLCKAESIEMFGFYVNPEIVNELMREIKDAKVFVGRITKDAKGKETEDLYSRINMEKLSLDGRIEVYNKFNEALSSLLVSIARDNPNIDRKRKDELKKEAIQFINGLQMEYSGFAAGLDLKNVSVEKVKFALEILQTASSTTKSMSTLSKADVAIFNEMVKVIPQNFSLDAIKERLPKDIGDDKNIKDYVIKLVKDPKHMDTSRLKESITKEYMSRKFHKPNEADLREIDGLVDRVVNKIGEGKNDFYCVSPELRRKIAHEVVMDHRKHVAEHEKESHHAHGKKPKGGQALMLPEAGKVIRDKISDDIVTKEQQVVRFDAVWAAIKSSFIHHPNDYKKLFEQYERTYEGFQVKLNPDEYKASIENFIKMFSEARGGRMDRSLLFSKEFAEAMKLHLGDPENSMVLLQNFKRDKAYNPAELCKAYNACMHNIAEIQKNVLDEKDAKIYVKLFTAEAIQRIGNSKRIDNHLLDGLRDKMISDSPFITSHKKRSDTEFAKEFGTHFPVLKNILEKVVFDQHPKEYEHAKDKQKYLDREVRNIVGKISNKWQKDAKGAKISVHLEFANLEKENVEAIAQNALGEKLKAALTEVQSKKSPIKFDNVLKQAKQEDSYLRYIKKNCPSLLKKIHAELKDIKDPLEYSKEVAKIGAALMGVDGADPETVFKEVDKAIKLSDELGAKVGLPLQNLFKEGEVDSEAVKAALVYTSQSVVDGMWEATRTITNQFNEEQTVHKYRNLMSVTENEYPIVGSADKGFNYDAYVEKLEMLDKKSGALVMLDTLLTNQQRNNEPMSLSEALKTAEAMSKPAGKTR